MTVLASRTLRGLFAGMVATLALLSAASAAICPGTVGATTTATSAFVVNGDGTVTDRNSELMWKQCYEGLSGAGCAIGATMQMTWRAALAAAKNSLFAGYSDWRVPNRQELESLLDSSCYSPATNDTVFPGTGGDYVWSSTTMDANPALAWLVYFYVGNSSADNKTYPRQVRLVRAGQFFDALGAGPCRLDVDGDSSFSASIDGLLIVRHLLNISGAALVSGIAQFPSTAKRTTPIDLSNYMASLNLDIDGSGGVPDAATDGMIVLRVMLGLVGAEVTAGLPIPANALRRDWITIAPYLRDVCLLSVGR